MPGTHRTPPDADGYYLVLDPQYDTPDEVRLVFGVTHPEDECIGQQGIPRAALPALVAALAAHLTVDARRALTRDLAAQDLDVVVTAADAAWARALAEGSSQ